MTENIILPNTVKDVLYSSVTDLTEICAPLFQATELDYLYFTRLYFNGTCLTLGSNPAWNEYFFKQYFHESQYPLEGATSIDYVLLDARFPEIAQYEAVGFAANKECPKLIEYYLNYLNDLKQFICFFHDKATSLLKKTQESQFKWRKPEEQTSIISTENSIMGSDFMIDSLKEHISPKRYPVEFKDKIVSLTKREFQCISSISKGMTYKDAAKAYSISPKTVESYLVNAKSKLQLPTKSQLIKFFQDNFM